MLACMFCRPEINALCKLARIPAKTEVHLQDKPRRKNRITSNPMEMAEC